MLHDALHVDGMIIKSCYTNAANLSNNSTQHRAHVKKFLPVIYFDIKQYLLYQVTAIDGFEYNQKDLASSGFTKTGIGCACFV